MERRIFWLLSVIIVLVAYVLRDLHVARVVMLNPLGGDAHHYVQYALNLQQGYFGSGAIPDAYRPPGYPALIALSQMLGGNWYMRLLQWQVVMGAATVAFTIAIGKQWLPGWAALLAGALLALWPHHIAFSAEVLTEVFTGFLLSIGILLGLVAKQRTWVWICAGIAFASASMANTVCLLAPVAVGFALIGRASPARWLALLAPVVVLFGGWAMRPVDGGMDRAWRNLAQGAQPLYHDAYLQRGKNPHMAELSRQLEAETRLVVDDPRQGLRAVGERMMDDPGRYAAWYLSKPWLLWGWDIRISAMGGPYMHRVRGSVLELPPLQVTTSALRILNPLIFCLAVTFAIVAALRPGDARAVSFLFLYVTVTHMVLQAEPRYSIPFRFLELLLAAAALGWVVTEVRQRIRLGIGSIENKSQR